jgi:cbb3-type cytochrome oxidase cytochrome c subunit
LVTTYRGPGDSKAVSFTCLEPTVALRLGADEAPHPRLPASGGSATWEGYLVVFRRGDYRFQVRLRGELALEIAGRKVLEAHSVGDKPALTEARPVLLEAGVHPFIARFTWEKGPAVVELTWQSNFFRREPVPYVHLGHLPRKETGALARDAVLERGRLLAEEGSCFRCHLPADDDAVVKGLSSRQGPDLSQVGQRIHAAWIERWLEAPQKVRPGTAMPEMFAPDEAGRTERYAVVRYLRSLGGASAAKQRQKNADTPPTAEEIAASLARGKELFHRIGCIACHGPYGETQPERKGESEEVSPPVFYPTPALIPLKDLGSKTTLEHLAEYLANPHKFSPAGRMPNMVLQGSEALDLARFLCAPGKDRPSPASPVPSLEQATAAFRRVDSRPEELAHFERLPPDARWIDLGKRIVIDKGCNSCHAIAPEGKQVAQVPASANARDLRKPGRQSAGCLADNASGRGRAPHFAFSAADREALRAFLRDGLIGPNSPAPAYSARKTLVQLNCLACHTREGEGGVTPDLVQILRRYENVESVEMLTPPTLTGIGHKLRTPWLRQLLTKAGRVRPYMALRMPQFGEVLVGRLPKALAALEGADPDDTVHKVPLTAGKLEAGRHLVGRNALGCISCHDLGGIPNTGTRGPDLVAQDQRVRYDWYLRWLEQPQRMQPDTRMPIVFPNGQSLLPSVLGGDATAQAEAVWAYLSLGPGLPLPEGLGPPPGLKLVVKDRPLLIRTDMPGTSPRAIAIGFAGSISAAYDVQTCQLAYAWSGSFLDATPCWSNGSGPPQPMGRKFWTAPPGCPVGTTTSAEPPDFAARANDPAFGAKLPEGKFFDVARKLQFERYTLEKEGLPTFHYRLESAGRAVAVAEQLRPLRRPAAAGISRQFTVQVPPDQFTWLAAGDSLREPQVPGPSGDLRSLDLKSGLAELVVNGSSLLLHQEGERPILLEAKAPPGSVWRIQRGAGRWHVLLRVPAPPKSGTVQAEVNVWSPYRNEPALLKELLSGK